MEENREMLSRADSLFESGDYLEALSLCENILAKPELSSHFRSEVEDLVLRMRAPKAWWWILALSIALFCGLIIRYYIV